MRLAVIVEGHGDVEAVPILIRAYFPEVQLASKPIRVRRDRFLANQDEQRRYLQQARSYLGNEGAVLILMDADSDCPATMSRDLAASLSAQAKDDQLHISFVMAKSEFETWLLAGADVLSLGEVPQNLEDVRGAKEELKRRLRRYSETVDQSKLTGQLVKLCDPELLRQKSPSFDKFWREMEKVRNLLIS